MTDYKNLKLIATSSPHIRAAENTRSIMLDVIIAMLPALAFAVVKFGFKALTLTLVSVIGCMFFEWGYRKIMKKPQSVNDLSAVVTGKRELKALEIDPEAVDPDDVEMLQDMIVAAVNEALRAAESDAASNMQKLTGGLGLPF